LNYEVKHYYFPDIIEENNLAKRVIEITKKHFEKFPSPYIIDNLKQLLKV